MAVMRVALEIDSDLYPELYAKLASLHGLAGREEKLRQLAALGLVWELARLHGPALWDLTAGMPGDEARVPQEVPDEALEEATAGAPYDDDVDLALGADPQAPARELPVLLDVVSPAEAGVGKERAAAVPSANDESPAPRLKSTRSARIARMKERGLFQNG